MAFHDQEWAWEPLNEVRREERGLGGFIEMAWDGPQFPFNAADVDLEFFVDGTVVDDEGLLLGWSAESVRHAARVPRELPFGNLARHYDPEAMTREVYPRMWDHDAHGELDYPRMNYRTLVAFFETTAAAGDAAIMELGI